MLSGNPRARHRGPSQRRSGAQARLSSWTRCLNAAWSGKRGAVLPRNPTGAEGHARAFRTEPVSVANLMTQIEILAFARLASSARSSA